MGGSRRLRVDEPERPRRAPLQRSDAADVSPVAGEVLRLQRSGGNRAVDSMLAQRRPADAKSDEPVTKTLIVDDPVGVLPVVSVSSGQDSRTDLFVIVPSTSQDPILFDWYAKGHHFEKCLVSLGSGATITINDALLSNVQGRDPLTLEFRGAIEVKNP